jgi:hypothetical protein
MNESITFNSGVKLEFYIDSTSFAQGVMDITNDFCLAYANTQNVWECTGREFEQLDDGFWSFPITEVGLYSLIVNPNVLIPIPIPDPPGPDPTPDPTPDPVDPDDDPTDPAKESFFEKNLIGVLISGGTLVAIIALLVSLYCCGYCACLGILCCCCRKK